MIPKVYDDVLGIILEFDFENGLALRMFMDDESAQDFVNIVQNKLNARL
jgi:hypothetical protein